MRQIGRLQLWVATALMAMLLLSACGKKQQAVETDTSGEESMPAEQVPAPDFGGDTTGSQPVESSDVDRGSMGLEDVFFDFDRFDLDSGDREILAANGRLLREQAEASILIEGHCDERGTVQYNLALGEKRAQQVRDYLMSLGVSAEKLEIVSYGKERPFASGANEAAWSQNRRAHFVVK
jgi:peptidoglycan-associated lipoprotein